MNEVSGNDASWIRRRRTSALLTQEELGTLAGLDARTIRDIELGRTKPRAATLRALAAALNEAERCSARRRTGTEPDRSGPPRPQELPSDVYMFVGRHDHLAELDQLIDAGSGNRPVTMAVVFGSAGIGKSGLAAHWAHRVRQRFRDGQIYLNLRGFDSARPVHPSDALAGFLRSLGLRDHDIPADEYERAARFRSVAADRRFLVVLDNARSVEQVRSLVPGTSSCFVLVTSRNALDGLEIEFGAKRLELGPLSEGQSVELLRGLIGDHSASQNGTMAELARRCNYLPLTLRLAANYVLVHHTTAVGSLVKTLDSATRLLAELDPGDAAESTLNVLSWSIQGVSSKTYQAFVALGALPGNDFDLHALAALCDTGIDDAKARAAEMVEARLLDKTRTDRYSFHDVLRRYGRQLSAATDRTLRGAAQRRLFAFYLSVAATAMDIVYSEESHHRPRVPPPATPVKTFDSSTDAIAWLQAERANLVAAGRAGAEDHPRFTYDLSATLWRYLTNGSHHEDALALYDAALQSSRRSHDLIAETRSFTQLASVHWALGRPLDAVRHLEHAIEIARQANDKNGEYRARINLGGMLWNLGRLDEGVSNYQIASRLKVHDRSAPHEHFTYPSLAYPFERHGSSIAAIETHHRALAAACEVGDAPSETYALCVLSVIHRLLGQLGDALAHAMQAVACARRNGYRPSEAIAVNELGLVHVRMGDIARAIKHLNEGLQLSRETMDRGNQGYALLYLSEARLRRPGRTVPTASLDEALTLSHATQDPDLEIKALNALGRCELRNGSQDRAVNCHEAAMSLALQNGNVYEQACAHLGLREAHCATGDDTLSRTHHRLAHEKFVALGAAIPCWDIVTEL